MDATRRGPLRTAVWASCYVAAAWLGRLTIIDGHSLSLVWPAAGIAVLWFSRPAPGRERAPDVAVLAACTVAVNLATGSGLPLALAFAGANLLQLAVFLRCARRLLGDLVEFGGAGSPSTVAHLWRLAVCALAATGAGALVGPVAVLAVTGRWSWLGTAVWLSRNSASILVVVGVGLLLRAAVRRRGRGEEPRAASCPGVAETTAVCVGSAAGHLLVFGHADHLPLAFVLTGFSVWVGSRFRPLFTSIHGLLGGIVAVTATLAGSGPFTAVDDVTLRALVVQVFVAMTAVTGLSQSLSRVERDRAVAELREARDEAAAQSDLLNAVLDTMDEGVAVLDANERFLVRNPAVARLMDGRRSPDDHLADSTYYGLTRADGTVLDHASMPGPRALRGEHVTEDLLLALRGGGHRVLATRATPMTTPAGERQALVVFADATAERTRHAELTAFAGVVAHDLRTPLAAVAGWAEVIRETLTDLASSLPTQRLRELLPADQVASVTAGVVEHRRSITEATHRIERSAARMGDLIEDLLTYATARDGRLGLQDVDLDALARAVVEERLHTFTDDRARPVVRVGALHPVRADPVLLRQLLHNLVGNAVKYTHPDAVPDIALESWRTGDGRVRVRVADRGIGIPEGKHTVVFEDFERAHRDGTYQGNGLGLAICRRIVDRHGGTITASDNPGGGSRFTFDLAPAGTAAAGVAAPLAEEVP